MEPEKLTPPVTVRAAVEAAVMEEIEGLRARLRICEARLISCDATVARLKQELTEARSVVAMPHKLRERQRAPKE